MTCFLRSGNRVSHSETHMRRACMIMQRTALAHWNRKSGSTSQAKRVPNRCRWRQDISQPSRFHLYEASDREKCSRTLRGSSSTLNHCGRISSDSLGSPSYEVASYTCTLCGSEANRGKQTRAYHEGIMDQDTQQHSVTAAG